LQLDTSILAAFTLLWLAIVPTPGPNSLLIMRLALTAGWRDVATALAGNLLAIASYALATLLGLSLLLAAAPSVRLGVYLLGGAYLVWLGIQVWRSPPIGIQVHASAEPRAGRSLFQQGALSALTNPKGILFFAAFLPQFIDPSRSLFVQFVIMAGTFAVIEIATEVFIAGMAHRISPWLRRVGRRFNQACGGIFMAIGAALPLRSS
jgi:threonine/homoserine/homoserine lactone efflux protein